MFKDIVPEVAIEDLRGAIALAIACVEYVKGRDALATILAREF